MLTWFLQLNNMHAVFLILLHNQRSTLDTQLRGSWHSPSDIKTVQVGTQATSRSDSLRQVPPQPSKGWGLSSHGHTARVSLWGPAVAFSCILTCHFWYCSISSHHEQKIYIKQISHQKLTWNRMSLQQPSVQFQHGVTAVLFLRPPFIYRKQLTKWNIACQQRSASWKFCKNLRHQPDAHRLGWLSSTGCTWLVIVQ